MSDEAREKYSVSLDLLAHSKLDEAAKSMEDLIASCPDFFDAYEGLAVVYNRLDQIDKAIELMIQLSQRDPKNVMAHSNLSVLYMKQGLKEKAEDEKAKATVLQFERQAEKHKKKGGF
jgi:Tfp pilus assembly protein PilF